MSSSSVRTTEVPVVYRRMITNSLLMSWLASLCPFSYTIYYPHNIC
jgi:hypothetical protein